MEPPARNAAEPMRLVAYDALRVFAILSVVAIHSMMPLRESLPTGSWPRIVDDLLHYAVPLFVFISGALVWGRYVPGPGSFRQLVSRRGRMVALPYLAWAMLFFAVALTQPVDGSSVLLRQAPALLLTGHVWYHLYFIPMLLALYLLTPLMAPVIRRWPEATLGVVYLLRIVVWGGVPGWQGAGAWLHGWAPDLAWSFAQHVVTHLPHMVLGAWFAIRFDAAISRRRFWPLLLTFGFALLGARSAGALESLPRLAAQTVYPLGMAATVLGLVLWAFSVERRLRSRAVAISGMAALSFGVYFVHPLILLAVWRGVGTDSAIWTTAWAIPGTWAATCSASLLIASALSRYKPTAWLVGVQPLGVPPRERVPCANDDGQEPPCRTADL